MLCITDEVPSNAFFATSAGTLSDGRCEQIREFVKEHPDTVFVAVDTFQIVRNNSIDTSYANDYDEIRLLKQLADELNICLLLVHHLRKQGDSDPFNKLTGTTGIVGAVDTAFVLDKSKRNADSATLYCTGRDVEDRQLELQFSKKDFVWKMLRDSMENREMLLPKEMELLIDFMKTQKSYSGSNTEFCEMYNAHTDYIVSLSLETPIHVAEDVKPLLIELKRIGNNVNQIATKINSGVFQSYGFQDVVDEQKKIYEQLLEIARKG